MCSPSISSRIALLRYPAIPPIPRSSVKDGVKQSGMMLVNKSRLTVEVGKEWGEESTKEIRGGGLMIRAAKLGGCVRRVFDCLIISSVG